MHNLNTQEIDAVLRQPPQKPFLREKIENMQQSLASGEGILPKVVGGVMAVPAALANIKPRDVQVKSVTI